MDRKVAPRPEQNYWTRRATRRSLLRGGGTGAVGLAALGLVGCGGDDDSDAGADLGLNTPTPHTGATPVDPFANAVKGGVLNIAITSDPPVLDPYKNPATNTKLVSSYVYSRLFKYRTGPGVPAAKATIVGDLADTYESSPDGLAWTIKLKTNAYFHDIAPVSGRQVTSDDVKFSWERATGPAGVNKALLSFVSKAEFPDASTVKFTLNEPNAAFLDVLADVNLIWVQPREAEAGFDPSTTPIGSGPWKLDSYQPNTVLKFSKHPRWFENGFPLMDGVNVFIIPEYANIKAQFQSRSLDLMSPNSDDIIEIKRQFPDSQVLNNVGVTLYNLYFDKLPNSPWREERVRQAISRSLDRSALNELVYNIRKLNDAGVKFDVPYNNIIPGGFADAWLDPVGSDAGPGKVNFEYNVAEAKKLLSAAGFENGFSAPYQYTANAYGTSHNSVAESTQGMLDAIGIKTQTDIQDYASKYYTQTYRGNFTGIAFGPESSFNEPGSYPLRLFTPNPLNKGGDTDEQLKKLAFDQQRELNPEKRISILKEIQRIHGERMYVVPSSVGAGPTWSLAHNNVKNANNFAPRISYNGGGEALPYYWKV